jgi:hypothetical protein
MSAALVKRAIELRDAENWPALNGLYCKTFEHGLCECVYYRVLGWCGSPQLGQEIAEDNEKFTKSLMVLGFHNVRR